MLVWHLEVGHEGTNTEDHGIVTRVSQRTTKAVRPRTQPPFFPFVGNKTLGNPQVGLAIMLADLCATTLTRSWDLRSRTLQTHKC